MHKIAMATFGAKFPDTINKSRAHDLNELSPMLLKDNQIAYTRKSPISTLKFSQKHQTSAQGSGE